MSEEYASMTSEVLEENELTMSSQYRRMKALTHPASPEAAKKIAGDLIY